MARHDLMDGKVQVYRRSGSPYWQCACSVAGQQQRSTTREESLARAKDVASDWYLGLLGKYRSGDLKPGKTFAQVADRFVDEFAIITQGDRSPIYVEGHRKRIKNHLNPFFGKMVVGEITAGTVQDYRVHRMKTERNGKPPARSTLHQEIVCLRQVLKTAHRHRWLEQLPDLSAPYRASSKISHRAWFSPEEYKRLYEATRERAKNPKAARWRAVGENLHDFVLFMANTGLRPDEALSLEFRDVTVAVDEPTGQRILEIAVRGKRGVGWCKSMPGAVTPFERVQSRSDGQPTDRLFPQFPRQLFNTVLEELNLKVDREGQSRTIYSLRHTYICMRLMEGADIYQVAKNCRTSVEMIETYYAAHIKNMIDASAINVRKTRPSPTRSANTAVRHGLSRARSKPSTPRT
ncbi:tyrosine-type recombinase/integrase [Caulobacter sp. ErkDOM-E]|uniref:tyrosine-type recombinase/integrase n=1 Tax=Caulobacter sp. ErkDOM-E TaxID=3402778 RepID=UPI003AF70D96